MSKGTEPVYTCSCVYYNIVPFDHYNSFKRQKVAHGLYNDFFNFSIKGTVFASIPCDSAMVPAATPAVISAYRSLFNRPNGRSEEITSTLCESARSWNTLI